MYRIGIVGSGPAAFYTALKLLKSSNQIKVDMFEKLPVPFGLVRYGVAPDHPEVKNVINTFNQVASHKNFRFFGNVTIGRDLYVKEMKSMYNGVVLAYGAAVDKKLGILGEDLKQMYSATDIVGWYNGLPDKENFQPDLSGEEAVIVGLGNVAIDIARILLSPIDLLRKTDIPDQVLTHLASSRIKRINLVGRRGPLQVAFTIKEFRELSKMDQVLSKIIISDDIKLEPQIIDQLPRPRRRLTNLIMEVMNNEKNRLEIKQSGSNQKSWIMHFLKSPQSILSDNFRNITALRFSINRLQGEEIIDTQETIDMPCQMVVRSIGYRSIQIDPDVPFDTKLNVIPNIRGRVIEDNNTDDKTASQMYCVGWIKRGPVGVIIDTLADAQETSETILGDIKCLKVSDRTCADVDNFLKAKGINVVSFSDWEAIDRLEVSLGQRKGKPREKLISIQRLMVAAQEEKKKNK